MAMSRDKFREIDALVSAHLGRKFGIRESSSPEEVSQAFTKALRDWRETAPAIGVSPMVLVAFATELMSH